MRIWLRRALIIVTALCLPFVITAFLLKYGERMHIALGQGSLVIGVVVGLMLLVAEFNAYAVPIAIVYCPLMLVALLRFELEINLWLGGEGL